MIVRQKHREVVVLEGTVPFGNSGVQEEFLVCIYQEGLLVGTVRQVVRGFRRARREQRFASLNIVLLDLLHEVPRLCHEQLSRLPHRCLEAIDPRSLQGEHLVDYSGGLTARSLVSPLVSSLTVCFALTHPVPPRPGGLLSNYLLQGLLRDAPSTKQEEV